jgi:hypothetical protein
MTESPLEELQSENQRLRDLVVSLTAALVRNIALEPPRDRRPASSAGTEDDLLRDADECFRCARVLGLKKEIAEALEATGHDFVAKAVEIEAALQREKRKQ